MKMMKRFFPILMVVGMLCVAQSMYARTDCSGYKESYPDHYCACYYDHTKLGAMTGINDLQFNDSIWFKTMAKIFLDGMTAYLFSESDVQVDIYQRCTSEGSQMYSFTIPKNRTLDIDSETINSKLESAGVEAPNAAVYVVFAPVEDGADVRLMCYPYNEGPNSTADNPLPVLLDMTYVSSHAYDVYELKADSIPASLALYTQWSEESGMPCHLAITRGSAVGVDTIVKHDFLSNETPYYFDPNLLAEVRATGESLYLHFSHDAAVAGRIITTEGTAIELVQDTTLCEGKGWQVGDTVLTESTVYMHKMEWLNADTLGKYIYQLEIIAPEMEYDTVSATAVELEEGYYYAAADSYIYAAGSYVYEIVKENECTRMITVEMIQIPSTGVDNISAQENHSRIIIQQGVVLIQRNGQTYSILGETIE